MRRGGLKGILTMGVLAGSLLAPGSAAAGSQMFLTLTGLTGESTADKHRDEIDVLSWSWGVSNGSARTRKGTLPAACVQDLHLVKQVDSASAGLIMKGMLGDVVPSGVLVVEEDAAGVAGSPREYIRLEMKNVTVTSFQTGGAGGDARPTESVTLHFESMQFRYQRLGPDGKAMGDPIVFDINAANTAGCK